MKRHQNREFGLLVRKCDSGKFREPVSVSRGHVWLRVLKRRLRELHNKRPQIQLRPQSPVELDRITLINCLRSSPRGDQGGTDGGTADSTVETERRSQGHCDWLHCASPCCPHIGQAIHEGVRSRMRPFSIRPLHQRRDRLCGPHAEVSLRRQPKHDDPHCGWCWCVTVGDVGEAAFNASGTIIVAFRPHVVCSAVIVSVDRCRRRGTFSDSGRGGGEQGDPLMPLSIGIQGALEEVAAELLPGEQLSAFLDDVYLLCDPSRLKVLYELLEETLSRVAGIQLHQGKTRVWNRAHGGDHRRDDVVRKESPLGRVINARYGLRGMPHPGPPVRRRRRVRSSWWRRWPGILVRRGCRSQHGVGFDHAVARTS